MYVDLDDFSSLNQSLGHQVGDRLLVEVSNRFKNPYARARLSRACGRR